MSIRTDHFGNILYILNFVHLCMLVIALFCLTVMWTTGGIFIEIINFTFGWQIISVICLLFVLVITGCVFLGALTGKPILGSWPKQRIELIYAIGLATLLLSVGLQTWTMFLAWLNPFFIVRYLIACIASWILLITWIAFLVFHLLRVRN